MSIVPPFLPALDSKSPPADNPDMNQTVRRPALTQNRIRTWAVSRVSPSIILSVVLGCAGSSRAPDVAASYVSRIAVGTATYTQLDAELFSGWTKEFTYPDSSDHRYWAEAWRSFYREPRVWGRVDLPKDIGRAVGDAEVYLMSGGGQMHRLIGVREGHFYDLPYEINDFLVDGGLLPSPKNVAQVVRIYTYFMIAFERMNYMGSVFMDGERILSAPRIDSMQRAIIPLVPRYKTQVLNVELAKSGWPPWPRCVLRLRALLTSQGRHTTIAVEFEESAGYPNRSFPFAWHMEDQPVPDCPPGVVPTVCGLRLDIPWPKEMRGEIGEVSGDTTRDCQRPECVKGETR